MDEASLLSLDACGIMRPERGAVVALWRLEVGADRAKWLGGAKAREKGFTAAWGRWDVGT